MLVGRDFLIMKCPTNSPASTSQVHRCSDKNTAELLVCNEIVTLDKVLHVASKCSSQKVHFLHLLSSLNRVSTSLWSCIYRASRNEKPGEQTPWTLMEPIQPIHLHRAAADARVAVFHQACHGGNDDSIILGS